MNIAVIVAAGSGSRLAEKLGMKKQYFPLIGGKEMFVSALEPFIEDPSFEHYIFDYPPRGSNKSK
jgi:2-C-methyl-D-erythritol 4-phosphate cytidylyltransferase